MASSNKYGEYTDARFSELVRDNVIRDRFVWSSLGWHRWDGMRWRPAPEVEVTEAVRKWLVDELGKMTGSKRRGDDEIDPDAVKRWVGLLNKGRIAGFVALAKGMAGVLVDAVDFDRHPDLLNTPTGVVCLRTGVVGPHDPALLLTKLTAASYDRGARHPALTAMLEAIPAECREWTQLRYGQAISGHPPPDDLLVVQQGAGENGKTTVVSSVAYAIGDYYTLVSDRVLLANPTDHPTELMDLRGARLAVIEETPEARRLSVARLKKTVGTPQITARLIRKDSVTFDATHTLILNTNYLPLIEEVDHGTWRRLAVLKFPYRFVNVADPASLGPDERIGDPQLRQRLKSNPAAQSAVLSWLVEGAIAWYASDEYAQLPSKVVEDTRAWRSEADLILAFIDDRLEFDPEAHVMTTELADEFGWWQREHGNQPWSEKLFTSRFSDHSEARAHGVEKRRLRASDGTSPSRPEATGRAMLSVPGQYRAWVGVRFARGTGTDGARPPEETGQPRTLATCA